MPPRVAGLQGCNAETRMHEEPPDLIHDSELAALIRKLLSGTQAAGKS